MSVIGGALQFAVDEEASVGADVVLPALLRLHAALVDPCREEDHWRARLERGDFC